MNYSFLAYKTFIKDYKYDPDKKKDSMIFYIKIKPKKFIREYIRIEKNIIDIDLLKNLI